MNGGLSSIWCIWSQDEENHIRTLDPVDSDSTHTCCWFSESTASSNMSAKQPISYLLLPVSPRIVTV